MRRSITLFAAVAMGAIMVAGGLATLEAKGPPPHEMVWEGCELYETVVTRGVFDPANGNFDELYVNPNGYKDGYHLISDAAPGTPGYNGGRWHKNVLKSSVPADKYANACSVADLDPADFMSTDDYFECPMLPRRGNN